MMISGIASKRNSVARPLMAFAAALLLTVALPGTASAQRLGYAAAPQAGPFGAGDQVLSSPQQDTAPDATVTDDEDAQLSDRLRRQVVAYNINQPAGTIVIDTANTYLYYLLGGGRAIRYGVGVGREGFTWAGTQTITRKAEWPDWHPPAQMIARQPYLPRFMAGGPGNPLGARAMYLGSTEYRIHGTNDPSTIGKFVSSGCIRLTNEDVADLFSRATVGTRVVVLPKSAPSLETRKPRPERQAMNIAVSSRD
ncbi:ErfK/YbiS/YcfS/YnhG [Rhodopseudomonas palustris HaA2]|uniref:ErfK/YbiS/YcfS/YnhG n=1 Tax=Rhodopseudomonas palustris (strain HaA2) TaxID=316058 RepID=Q2J0A9_RHOP2|nr:L,D-transpeptidase [Rhodopseudomonas palustris]ABD06101.1 ErfK/YbiS/YcfS/YnhG [Rhodopseudomonas palustris HaA2]